MRPCLVKLSEYGPLSVRSKGTLVRRHDDVQALSPFLTNTPMELLVHHSPSVFSSITLRGSSSVNLQAIKNELTFPEHARNVCRGYVNGIFSSESSRVSL